MLAKKFKCFDQAGIPEPNVRLIGWLGVWC